MTCQNLSTHRPSTYRSSLRVDRLPGSCRTFSTPEVHKKRFSICILADLFKLTTRPRWRMKSSEVCRCVRQLAPPGWRLSLILTLSMLPLRSMDAARCQVLLTFAQRHQLWCVSDPSFPEELFLPSLRTSASACAHSFCVTLCKLVDVRAIFVAGLCHRLCGFMTSARIASACLHPAQVLSWGTRRRASDGSPPD